MVALHRDKPKMSVLLPLDPVPGRTTIADLRSGSNLPWSLMLRRLSRAGEPARLDFMLDIQFFAAFNREHCGIGIDNVQVAPLKYDMHSLRELTAICLFFQTVAAAVSALSTSPAPVCC